MIRTILPPKSLNTFSLRVLATIVILSSCLLILHQTYSSLRVYFQDWKQLRKPSSVIVFNNAMLPSDANVEPGAPQKSIENDTKKYRQENKTSAVNDLMNDTGKLDSDLPTISSGESNSSNTCDLYKGKWIYDARGPLYTNTSCPVITPMQNCQSNGRPDKEYEYYRWKPDQCDLHRFNPRKFLEKMRGKTVAFVGDSLARNQFVSLLCILWQEEAPQKIVRHKVQRWFFRSTSTTLIRYWSSWLIHHTSEPFQDTPKGIPKLFLNIPDHTFMQHISKSDVLVVSSGHWFNKPSIYVFNNSIVGWQRWWANKAHKLKPINSVEAYGMAMETAVSAIVNYSNFTGVAIVRSYSPDHYEGKSCTGNVRPVDGVRKNEFVDSMYGKQIAGFKHALERSRSGSNKVRFMDVTRMFGYRADGHPGPFRSTRDDGRSSSKRGRNSGAQGQDCMHWCMPGPVDTWNEIFMELVRREFK